MGVGRRHPRLFVVTDANVWSMHGNGVAKSLAAAGHQVHEHVIPAGEGSKSPAQVAALYNELQRLRWGRDEPILGLGGGVVTDLAAFAAATWKRGVPLILCPTTTEAALDACIGGKCGINLGGVKNVVGTFYHAHHLWIDPTWLSTLSDRDFRAGLAEAVKHAVVVEPELLRFIERKRNLLLDRQGAAWASFIIRNLKVKASVVRRDERETGGARMILNFGHTIGHALESASGFKLRHGECVALGMLAEAWMSVAMGLLKPAVYHGLRQVVEGLGLPCSLPGQLRMSRVIDAVGVDKKVREGRPVFVLLRGPGRPALRSDVPPSLIRRSLRVLRAAGG